MKYKKRKLKFTKEFIESLPKTIDEVTGCWLYLGHINLESKYASIKINYKPYLVHRLSLCVYNNLDYFGNWLACHIQSCHNRHCFNPTHLYPGSHEDNMKDMTDSGRHKEQQKLNCPKCGGKYATIKIKTGFYKGKITRICKNCRSKYMREWKARK